MHKKTLNKKQAIKLRKSGLSYNEILLEVPVAKSTLSLWLRSVGLSKRQKQKLTAKRKTAQLKGAESMRRQRLMLTEEIKTNARKKVRKISSRELWLIGTALYWAEGSKAKENNVSERVRFGNSDPRMLRIFLRWLTDTCKFVLQDIKFEIYIHKSSVNNIERVKMFWAKEMNVPLNLLQTVYFKKNNPKTRKSNVDADYFGLLRIIVRRSTNFNREIAGWIEGVCDTV